MGLTSISTSFKLILCILKILWGVYTGMYVVIYPLAAISHENTTLKSPLLHEFIMTRHCYTTK